MNEFASARSCSPKDINQILHVYLGNQELVIKIEEKIMKMCLSRVFPILREHGAVIVSLFLQ